VEEGDGIFFFSKKKKKEMSDDVDIILPDALILDGGWARRFLLSGERTGRRE